MRSAAFIAKINFACVYSALSLYYYGFSVRPVGTHITRRSFAIWMQNAAIQMSGARQPIPPSAKMHCSHSWRGHRCTAHENKFQKMTFVFDNVNYTLREAIIYTISFGLSSSLSLSRLPTPDYLAESLSLFCSRHAYLRGEQRAVRDSRRETRRPREKIEGASDDAKRC